MEQADQTKKSKARAAWRAWYQRNQEAAKKYYRDRYAAKLRTETEDQRNTRLARARETQKRYESRKKKNKG